VVVVVAAPLAATRRRFAAARMQIHSKRHESPSRFSSNHYGAVSSNHEREGTTAYRVMQSLGDFQRAAAAAAAAAAARRRRRLR
jgi:hypothetical protein